MRKVVLTTAVILAAGTGSRLQPLTNDRPKCLIEITGMTLLSRLLAQLEHAGVSEICVVTGHRADVLRDHLGEHPRRARVHLVFNADFDTANNAFSLWAARDAVTDRPFLLCDGDVVLTEGVVERLVRAPEENALLVEARADMGEEEMKVAVAGDRVSKLSKGIDPRSAFGESIGVQKVGEAAVLWRTLGEIVGRGARDEYYEAAFQLMIDRGARFGAVPVSGDEWIEIDDHADLERARTRFR